MEKVLVTFDIDGTILNCADGGENHIKAVNHTAFDLYKVPLDTNLEEYIGHTFVGTTDSWIAEEIIKKATGVQTVAQKDLDAFEKLECEYYEKFGVGSAGALPGVRKVIETLNTMPNVTISMCTGNYEKIAWIKVEHAGVADLFKEKLGGFGHIIERSNILRGAIKQAEELRGHKFDRCIHIGDAVSDVKAAQAAGAIAVAVETGSYKKPDYPQPCFVLENMDKGYDDFINIVKTGKPLSQ